MQTIIRGLELTTLSFFKTLRNTGPALTAVSGIILTTSLVLPATVITVAGHLAVGGAVAASRKPVNHAAGRASHFW